jgi:ATP-binding protein involved in chromosome partitioning
LVTQEKVREALRNVLDPEIGKPIEDLGMLKDIEVQDGTVRVHVLLTVAGCPLKDTINRDVTAAVSPLEGVRHVEVVLGEMTGDQRESLVHNLRGGRPEMPTFFTEGDTEVIAVASGKGGVGKSTTAVNLAMALSAEGASIGVLDADIYGPSQPRMLGVSGQPESKDGKSLEPMENYGVQAMSIGFLIDEETPMIWRGPMVTQALEQLLNDTRWRELDYLVIDLPPGTGDIQLTLAQKIPVSGAVIVTTPQDIALLDARRSLKMFEKVDVPVLGIVENMSTHICSNCGFEEHIFGAGGAVRMSKEYSVDVLGSLPLDIHIREQADGGKPTVVADPNGRVAQSYREIARRAAAKLALQGKDFSARIPKIVIQNN